MSASPHAESRARIRSARPEDAQDLVALEKRCFRSYYREHRFDERQFRYYLERPSTLAHVGVLSEDLAGYCLGIQYGGSRRHVARIHGIAVHPEMRQGGLGRRLLRAFVRAARRRSCEAVLLDVAAPNRRAMALFEGEGFEVVRRLPDHYGEGVDGLRMRRAL